MARSSPDFRSPLIGERFGKRTIISIAPPRYRGQTYVVCRCDCGREGEVEWKRLRQGGCLSCHWCRAKRPKHGACLNNTPSDEYGIWASMKDRCTNPRSTNYYLYGGRGISVCPEWLEFETFLRDVGPRPSPLHSLDRMDTNGPYSPENIRWATREQQANNMRSNVRIEHQGRSLTVPQWSREVGINMATIRSRLRSGWSVAEALNLPPDSNRNRKRYPSPI